MLYISIFNVLVLLSIITPHRRQLSYKVYLVCSVCLFTFAAFRWQVGCDWSGYFNQYLIQAENSWSDVLEMREPLWWGILELQHIFGLPYPWINVASSLIFFIGLHLVARRQPSAISFLALSFPILIVNMPMTAMRQGAAIGIMCYAFLNFIDRKTLAFTLLVLLAGLVHNSALVFIFLVPLCGGHFSPARILLAIILFVPGVFVLLGTSGASLYIDQDTDSQGAIFRNLFLILTSLLFFLFCAKKWRNIYPDDYRLALVGAVGMSLVAPVLLLSTVVADRFGYYLVPIQCMIFARLPYLMLGRSKIILILGSQLSTLQYLLYAVSVMADWGAWRLI